MSDMKTPSALNGWTVEDRHEGRGLTAYKRSPPDKDRGSVGGRVLRQDVQVWTDDGQRLISTSMGVEYEYFAIVQAKFASDGSTVEICGQGDEIKTAVMCCDTGKRLSYVVTEPGA